MAMATSEIEQVTTLINRSTQDVNARWSRANTRLYTKVDSLEFELKSLKSRVDDVESKARTLNLVLLVTTTALAAMILIVATAI